jgi:hypothetical protein
MDSVTSTSDHANQAVANLEVSTEQSNNETPQGTPQGSPPEENNEEQQDTGEEVFVIPAQIMELINNPIPDLTPEELVVFKYNINIIKRHLNAYARANNLSPFIFERVD